MNAKTVMAGLAVGVLLAGCASLERTSPGIMDGLDVVGGDTPALETVVVRNSGFGCFYSFCGVCGDVQYDNEENDIKGGMVFFNNICECGDCYRTVQAVANDEGKALTNVSMFNNTLPSGAITSYLQLLGFLVEFGDVGCSGVLRAKK